MLRFQAFGPHRQVQDFGNENSKFAVSNKWMNFVFSLSSFFGFELFAFILMNECQMGDIS